jgi:hypothetical protein
MQSETPKLQEMSIWSVDAEPHRLPWRQKHRKRKTSQFASNQPVDNYSLSFFLKAWCIRNHHGGRTEEAA